MTSALLAAIERESTRLPITLGARDWLASIPAVPGWYAIETVAPVTVLGSGENPGGRAHYNLSARVRRIESLAHLGFTIQQNGAGPWVVYSGHARNLKSRAREHVFGHAKTACLGLRNHLHLMSYDWAIRFTPISAVIPSGEDDEAVRIFGEQLWRAKYGWPILCVE